MAFPTKSKAHTDLIAALHPYDLTARPQIVRKDWNPGYYKALKTFEEITGVGGVLNTSFNLHGDPIVCSPKDALAIGSFYITKNRILLSFIFHHFISIINFGPIFN